MYSERSAAARVRASATAAVEAGPAGWRRRGRCSPGSAGHRWQDDHRRAVLQARLEAVAQADVLAVDVRVHEAVEVAVTVEQLLTQAGVLLDERGESSAQVASRS